MQNLLIYTKQGGIRGNPVLDSWARAVMQKRLRIKKCDGRKDGPANQHSKVKSRVFATKKPFQMDQQTN